MKVTAILKGDPDALGRKRIYIRINVGEKRTYQSTRLWVLPTEFKAGKVVGHPHARKYNDMLKEKIVEVEYGGIKNETPYPDADLRTYANRLIDLWEKDRKDATISQFRRAIDHFIAWHGSEIKLSRITITVLNNYKAYLNKKYHGSNNVWRNFKNLRKMLRMAVDEKVIKENPLRGFDFPTYKDPQKGYLTQEEIDRIETYLKQHCPPGLRIYAGWFLIGCYTGLRYSDMKQFDQKQHIKGGRMILYTIKGYKGGEVVSIPFNAKLKELFQYVDYQPMTYTDKAFNENLKIIQKAVDPPIEANMTIHLARHSFAVRCASAGIPIEVTAKLMAHTDMESTSIYYKITDRKVDDEFNKLF